MTQEAAEAREALRKGHAEWQRRAEAAEAQVRDMRFEILAHKSALDSANAEVEQLRQQAHEVAAAWYRASGLARRRDAASVSL